MNKYIRTKDNSIRKVYADRVYIVECEDSENKRALICIDKKDILKQADTIEELCDELVVVQKDFHDLLNADTHCLQTLKRYYEINKIEVLGIYGAIWTDKGLIYVAKMNDKGELELL